MIKLKKIEVEGTTIGIVNHNEEDYISLTDMLKAKDGSFFISDWLRNANTLDYIKAWEIMNNPHFNYGEFATIRQEAGSNSFKVSVKELMERANVTCMLAKAGRYGGTYAHKDIAFNFGMWISPVFQLYIVKEYQRLKEIESNQYNLEWNVKRVLSKVNYTIQTDAVKEYVLPQSTLPEAKKNVAYTEEATYMWHSPKNKASLIEEVKQIDNQLNIIREKGRQYFLENSPDNFTRILHDYSANKKGFILWKSAIEEFS